MSECGTCGGGAVGDGSLDSAAEARFVMGEVVEDGPVVGFAKRVNTRRFAGGMAEFLAGVVHMGS